MKRMPLVMTLTQDIDLLSVNVDCAEVAYTHGFQSLDALADHAKEVVERWVRAQYACSGKEIA